MRSSLALVISLAVASVIDAAAVTFHLIAPSASSNPSVSVNGGAPVTMTAPVPDCPHYTAVVEAPDGAKYKYKAGSEEVFERTLPAGRSETYNDFFNRTVTVTNLPKFPWPLQDEGFGVAQWQRAAPFKPLFDDSYVGTLIFSGSTGSNLQEDVPTRVTLYIILKDQILTFPETNWFEYKSDTWKFGSLFQITQKAEQIGGRTMFKLRTGEFDPTQLRERVYTDLSNSLGVPVAQETHFRAYANGKPLGLFVLTDLVTNGKTINSTVTVLGQTNHPFHVFEGGDPAKANKVGPFLICGTGATFIYKDDNPNTYAACWGQSMGRSDAKMLELVKAVKDLDASNPATLEKLERLFDYDTFLRQMVLEYLTVNWDGYWDQSSNFAMYLDGTGKWYFTDNDFDQTFGSANSVSDGPTASYKTYPARSAAENRPVGDRPLITKLLTIPKYRERFETILIKTVKHTFNPVAFNRRINAMADIMRPEVFWDHSFKPDTGRMFNFAAFDTGLDTFVTYLPPNEAKGGVGNGLRTWVANRADAIATEFNFAYDTVAIDPPEGLVLGSNTTSIGPTGTSTDYNSPTGGTFNDATILSSPRTWVSAIAASVAFFTFTSILG